jgi:uncharacterized protein YbbK (DUF523 family)
MILVSACLVGEKCRYDGNHNLIPEIVVAFGETVRCCPEVLGGLPTPRVPAEIVGGTAEDVLDGKARVLTKEGADVTKAFLAGAHRSLEMARENQVSAAVLKESSPSCGSCFVFDGTFSDVKIPGIGLTTALLRRSGIPVYSEENFKKMLL